MAAYAGLDHSATSNIPPADSLPYIESLLAGEPVPEAALHRERALREKAFPQSSNRNPVMMTKNRPGLQACASTLSGRLCRKRNCA